MGRQTPTRQAPFLLSLLSVFATAALYAALFLSINYFVLRGDTAELRDQVHLAYESGDLQRERYLPFDTRIGRHQYNDCLILSYFYMDYESDLHKSISPIAPFSGNPCEDLYKLSSGENSESYRGYYHRYLHGHRVVANLLVPAFGVSGARAILYYISYGLLLSGLIAFLLKAAVRAGRPNSSAARPAVTEAFAAATVISAFLLFYGLPYYGMSFSHAPPDIALFVFLLVGLWFNLLSMPLGRFLVVIAGFASFTAYFEFFTGGAPIGLAAVLGVIAINSLTIPNLDLLKRRLLLGAMAFVVAFVAAFAFKLLEATAVFGYPVLGDFVEQLAHRMGGEYAENVDHAKAAEYGFDPRGHSTYSLYSLLFLAGKMVYSSSYIAFGSMLLGGLLLVGATGTILLMFFMTMRREHDPLVRFRQSALLFSAAVIPLWFLLFLNHSVIHASFMVRIMAWPIAVAAVMSLIAVLQSRGRLAPIAGDRGEFA